MFIPFVRFITGSTGQVISNLRYNKKHKPKELYLTNVRHLAKKMNMTYDKPVYVTDNPLVFGPFTNLFSRKIFFPLSDSEILSGTEREFAFAHELAHIKDAPKFIGEMSLAMVATWAFITVLARFAINLSAFIFAELAFIMLAMSFVMRRNEARADSVAGRATSSEDGIAVFEYYEKKVKGDGSGMTHPSFRSRKKRLERLFDPDQHQ